MSTTKTIILAIFLALLLGVLISFVSYGQEKEIAWVRFTEPTEFAVVRGDSVYFYDVRPRTVLDTVLVLKAPAKGLIIGTKGLEKPISPIHNWQWNQPIPYLKLNDGRAVFDDIGKIPNYNGKRLK